MNNFVIKDLKTNKYTKHYFVDERDALSWCGDQEDCNRYKVVCISDI